MSFTSIQIWDVTTSFCYADVSWRRNRWNTNMIFVIITYENNLFFIVYGHRLLYIIYRHNLIRIIYEYNLFYILYGYNLFRIM